MPGPWRVVLAVLIVGGLCFGGVALWYVVEADLESIEATVRLRFPNVEQMSTAALADALAAGETPLLLDVRTSEEQAVSQLPDARTVAPGSDLPAWLLTLPRETPIVAYCAVGYRSSAYVERLRDAGFSDVVNLEGSIFAWANEGRPLVKNGRPTDRVHPYDETWSRLVDADKRAELTPR